MRTRDERSAIRNGAAAGAMCCALGVVRGWGEGDAASWRVGVMRFIMAAIGYERA